jgi:hypothetical protein
LTKRSVVKSKSGSMSSAMVNTASITWAFYVHKRLAGIEKPFQNSIANMTVAY